jgi:hypothetical protein
MHGRGRGIRTPDPLLPKQMRYQTALYPGARPPRRFRGRRERSRMVRARGVERQRAGFARAAGMGEGAGERAGNREAGIGRRAPGDVAPRNGAMVRSATERGNNRSNTHRARALLFSRLPTPDSRLPIPDSRFPIPDSRLPTPDSRFPTPDSRFPTPDSRLPTPDSRLPTPDSRLPIPDSRFPIPDSRFPTPAPKKTAAKIAAVSSLQKQINSTKACSQQNTHASPHS